MANPKNPENPQKNRTNQQLIFFLVFLMIKKSLEKSMKSMDIKEPGIEKLQLQGSSADVYVSNTYVRNELLDVG